VLAQDIPDSVTVAAGKSPQPLALVIGRAWEATLSLRHDEASGLVALAESTVAELAPEVSRRNREQIELLRAVGVALRDEGYNALSLALSCTRQGWPRSVTGVASTLCRFGYWKLGDVKSVYAIARRPAGVAIRRRDVLAAIYDLSIEAAIDIDRLRFPTARRLATDALTLAEERFGHNSAVAALPASLLAQIEYEEGRFDQAETLLDNRLPVIAAAGTVECAIRAYAVLARIAARRGLLFYAMIILQEAEVLGERRGWPRLVAASLAERLDLILQHSRPAEAQPFAERLALLAERRASRDGSVQREIERYAALGRCRIDLAQDPSRAVVAALRQLEYEALSRKNLYLRVQIGLSLVDALMALDEEDEAIAILTDALELGAIAGLCSSFLEGGARLCDALRRFHGLDHRVDDGQREMLPYVESLLTQFGARRPAAGQSFRLPSMLTERERDIVRLIGLGQSNKGIAKALEIAPETVKSHIKSIFFKLGAGTRAEAVAKAQGLGLI